MVFNLIIKKLFKLVGLNVTRIYKEPDIAIDKEIQRKAQVREEAKRFKWLDDYHLRTIIDIGANEGQFAEKILTVLPSVEVHCFEPLQEAFKKLQSNFSKEKNIFLYNFGLGETNEVREIFKNEYSPSSSLLEMVELHKSNFDYAVNVIPETIELRKLDEVLPGSLNKPLLVKIDVQGYEMFVLKGGYSVIRQADIVIIETSFYPLYLGQALFDDIYEYFKKIGFGYYGNVEQLVAPSDHKVLQADAIFIRNQ